MSWDQGPHRGAFACLFHHTILTGDRAGQNIRSADSKELYLPPAEQRLKDVKRNQSQFLLLAQHSAQTARQLVPEKHDQGRQQGAQ